MNPISKINGKSAKEYIISMLKEAHLDLLFAFVLIYAFVSMGYRSYARGHPDITLMSLSRLFDYVMLVVLIVFVIYYYLSCDRYTKDHLLDVMMKTSYTFYTDPLMMFSTMIFICVFTAIIFALNIPSHGVNTPLSVIIIAHKGWYLLYSQVLYNILKYVFGMDFIKYLEDPKGYYGESDPTTATPVPTCDSDRDSSTDPTLIPTTISSITPTTSSTPTAFVSGTPSPTKTPTPSDNNNAATATANKDKEVYQVTNDLYSYEESAGICKSLDSRLATYEEIELAYKNGAEWCGYGWSENQMAFFPTQSETWKKMQTHPETKHLCGRPGVNGGFMKDPTQKFGVNCYGVKPDEKMRTKGIEPDTPEYLALFGCGKIVSDISKLKDGLEIKPFRPDFWSYKSGSASHGSSGPTNRPTSGPTSGPTTKRST